MKAPIVTITARTGGEPDLTFLNTGTAVTKVRAVWSQDRPDGVGGWIKEHETWLTIEWWEKAAEHTADLAIDAGDLVRVTGALFMESFTRRDGSAGQALKMRADGTPRVWRKGTGGEQGPAAAPARERHTPPPPADPPRSSIMGGHDDPPF